MPESAMTPSQTTPVPAAEADSPTSSGPYAIVEASGQQFWVQPNRYYDLDRINAEVDSTVTLENVLLVKDAKGATLGHPFITGATVELKVMADGVLIRPVLPRLSLAERLASYTPMEGEATEAMAWDPIGTEVIE
jgi:hypothetical protein